MAKIKANLYQSVKLDWNSDSIQQQLEDWLMKKSSNLIEQIEDSEELIKTVFKNTSKIFQEYQIATIEERYKILDTLECHQEINWMIFIEKLNSSTDQNILTTLVFKMLLRDLTLREKACVPFWNQQYEELSGKLWSPIKTDSVDLDSSSSNSLCQKEVEKLQLSVMNPSNQTKKNLQKTYCQSFISSHVDKWANENIKEKTLMKTLKIQLNLTKNQKILLNEYFNTSRFVYNRTRKYIKECREAKINIPSKYSLRNMFITANTKLSDRTKEIDDEIMLLKKRKSISKEELQEKIKRLKEEKKRIINETDKVKNENVNEWELNTPKEIRYNSLKTALANYNSCMTQVKRGNIKMFSQENKKSKDSDTIELDKVYINISNNEFIFLPSIWKDDQFVKIRNNKLWTKINKIGIQCNPKILKVRNSEYYLLISYEDKIKSNNNFDKICGIDLGIRTMATVYDTDGIYEFNHRKELIDKLNYKKDTLNNINKSIRYNNKYQYKTFRIKKKSFKKIEKRLYNVIMDTQWKFCKEIFENYDTVFLGNIKSHDIVSNTKHGSSKGLTGPIQSKINRNLNDMKFYQLKQKMIHKATEYNKKLIFVNEAYTSKTCSSCGNIYNIEASKVYTCKSCNSIMDRDANASKNILMKGLLSL